MKTLMIFVVMLLVTIAPVFAQEAEEEKDADAITQELVDHKVALLAQRVATVQAKANWLDRERVLLQQEQVQLNADFQRVSEEIAELLGCEAGYDLQKRACKPVAEESEK